MQTLHAARPDTLMTSFKRVGNVGEVPSSPIPKQHHRR